MSVDALFRPFQVKSLKLPNRIVMAPMTRSFSPGGVPTSDVAAYYRRRAEGGVGLIVTEGTVVERPAARNDARVPVFHGEGLPEWKKVVEQVHAAGGLIAPQIWHVGSARGQGAEWEPLGKVDSPSGFVAPGKQKYEPMTEEDVADTIAAFAKSARAAKDLGFDAVELHGAHGYLIDQFFWGGVNARADLPKAAMVSAMSSSVIGSYFCLPGATRPEGLSTWPSGCHAAPWPRAAPTCQIWGAIRPPAAWTSSTTFFHSGRASPWKTGTLASLRAAGRSTTVPSVMIRPTSPSARRR